MGKTNGRMAKSRENTNESSFGISPVKSQGKLTQDLHDLGHDHEWYFATDYPHNGAGYSKFACLCGAVKRVKQFEVEE